MVDVNAQIDAVERAVVTGETEGTPTRRQTLAQTYPSPLDDVWDAVTSAERIPRWFLPVTGELRLGGRYQLVGNAGGEVLECEPPDAGVARYRITWEYGGGVTWVTVTLTAVSDSSTRLELEHVAGLADVPEDFWDQYGPAATGMGWDSGLLGLALYLSDAEGRVTPEEAAAWTVTDEGKSFMRGSADAWAAAHVRDGGDPAAARAASDATYALYVGEVPSPMG